LASLTGGKLPRVCTPSVSPVAIFLKRSWTRVCLHGLTCACTSCAAAVGCGGAAVELAALLNCVTRLEHALAGGAAQSRDRQKNPMSICLRNDVDVAQLVPQLPPDATLPAVERAVLAALRNSARRYNQKRPEVIVLAHEQDPRCGTPPPSVASRCVSWTGAAPVSQQTALACAQHEPSSSLACPSSLQTLCSCSCGALWTPQGGRSRGSQGGGAAGGAAAVGRRTAAAAAGQPRR